MNISKYALNISETSKKFPDICGIENESGVRVLAVVWIASKPDGSQLASKLTPNSFPKLQID